MTKKSWIILGSTLGGVTLTAGIILPLTVIKNHTTTQTRTLSVPLPPSDNVGNTGSIATGTTDNLGKTVTSFTAADMGTYFSGGTTYCEKVYYTNPRIFFPDDGSNPLVTLHIKTTGGINCWDAMIINEQDYTFIANQNAADCHQIFDIYGDGHPFQWEIKAKSIKRDGNTAKFRLDTWEGAPYDSTWSWGIFNQYCDMQATVVS